jgi:hypothetical protein
LQPIMIVATTLTPKIASTAVLFLDIAPPCTHTFILVSTRPL